jgi:hypothetical protein
MPLRNASFEVEDIEQLALIDRLPTHHDPPPPTERNHDSSMITSDFFDSIDPKQAIAARHIVAYTRLCGRLFCEHNRFDSRLQWPRLRRQAMLQPGFQPVRKSLKRLGVADAHPRESGC